MARRADEHARRSEAVVRFHGRAPNYIFPKAAVRLTTLV